LDAHAREHKSNQETIPAVSRYSYHVNVQSKNLPKGGQVKLEKT